MKRFARRNIYILVAIPVIMVLLLCELFLFKESSSEREAARIYNVFVKKERQCKQLIDSVVVKLNSNPKILADWSMLSFFKDKNQGLELAVFKGKGLLFWSSSSIAFPSDVPLLKKSQGLIHLPTGWYYRLSRVAGIYTVNGYVLIKREFSIP